MANVSVGAVEKVRPRDSIQDSGVAGERTMDLENDAGLVRFAQTVLEHFSRDVHGADANRVGTAATPETAARGLFLQPR